MMVLVEHARLAGSIFIRSDIFNIDIVDGGNITFEANGGDGGHVNHASSHGGGGGGGSCLVKGMGFHPDNTAGITTSTEPGAERFDDHTTDPRITAKPGLDANGVIAYGNTGFILPVDLLEQKVICTSTGAEITWATATEINNDYFEIEKSEHMREWKFIPEIAGALNSHIEQKYESRRY